MLTGLLQAQETVGDDESSRAPIGLIVVFLIDDALSAKLVADAGFKVTFMSGFAVSATRLGLPDTGLISFAEMLDSLRNCCAAAGKVPLIGDGDTGYGNALNVQRTVIEYARAGAAGVMIEDQVAQELRPHPRQAGGLARRGADEDPRRGRCPRRRRHPDHGADRCARGARLRRGAGALPGFRGRRRRHHLPRSARERGRDAALLPAP